MKYSKIFTFILLSILVTACTNAGLFVANTLSRFGDYSVHRNISYGDKNEQLLDIYIPGNITELNKSSLTTVVFFYGGCWGACNELEKDDYRFVGQAFATNNIVTVIVDYRQFPNVLFHEIINDSARAVDWVNNNITSYTGSPSNIYLMGHSSGAHLASMLNFNETYLAKATYKNIKGFIGLAGAYDFLPFDEPYQPALFAPPSEYPNSQTINFVDGDEPPSLLLYGNNDSRVKRRNVTSLSALINNKKGAVETRFYDDIDHVGILSALSIPFRDDEVVFSDILAFVNRQ